MGRCAAFRRNVRSHAVAPPGCLAGGVARVGAGCEPRGHITIDPTAARVGNVETLLVATSREATPGFEIFSRERSQELGFARFDVSVPPDRAPGTVIYPEELPGDPRTDFLTVSAARINGSGNFLAAVDRAVLERPVGDRRVVVFVHGYNNTFSEGLYRQAQMLHDFGTPAVGVHYAWPSAADPALYAYDRDSAFFARDGLELLLRLLARSRSRDDRAGRAFDGCAGGDRGAAADGADRGAGVLRQALRGGADVARRGRGPVPQRGAAAGAHGHPVVHLRLEPGPGAPDLVAACGDSRRGSGRSPT